MPRNPMPATVKVGCHTYKLVRKSRPNMPLIDGERPNGYYDPDALTIGVLKGGGRSKVQEWIVHEALHAIWPHGFGFEEDIVTKLSPRLLQLIKQNPALFEYLRS